MIFLGFNYQGFKEGKNNQPYKNDNSLECQSKSTRQHHTVTCEGWMMGGWETNFPLVSSSIANRCG
jgi:hypothetical protein